MAPSMVSTTSSILYTTPVKSDFENLCYTVTAGAPIARCHDTKINRRAMMHQPVYNNILPFLTPPSLPFPHSESPTVSTRSMVHMEACCGRGRGYVTYVCSVSDYSKTRNYALIHSSLCHTWYALCPTYNSTMKNLERASRLAYFPEKNNPLYLVRKGFPTYCHWEVPDGGGESVGKRLAHKYPSIL